jgi:hypothetical protein
MAVTATAAAPASAVKPAWKGPYGPSGGAVAATVSEVAPNKRIRTSQVTLSGTYETGGFELDPATFGLAEIHHLAVVCDAGANSSGDAVPRLTSAGSPATVTLYGADETEIADTTSVSDHVYTLLVVGI